MTYSPDWEKDFDKRYVLGDFGDIREYGNVVPLKAIKSYISSLLQAREEWLRGEIEKMKGKIDWKSDKEHIENGDVHMAQKNHGGREALDGVLSLLTPKN